MINITTTDIAKKKMEKAMKVMMDACETMKKTDESCQSCLFRIYCAFAVLNFLSETYKKD